SNLANPDEVTAHANDGQAFALGSPFNDGLPSSVTSLSSTPLDDYRFLGSAVVYLPEFRWSDDLPVPCFAVGAPGENLLFSDSGRVYMYHHDSEEGIVESTLTPASFTQNMGTGYTLDACDFNGDGASDLVVGCNRAESGSGEVTIYLGGPDFDLLPDITLTPAVESQTFGKYVAGVGDLNGDGFDEVAVCDELASKAYVVFGREAQQVADPLALTVSDDGLAYTGITLDATECRSAAGGHDLTGDGQADLVIGSKEGNFGWVTVYAGPLTVGEVPLIVSRIRGGSKFAWDLAVDGDVNGDGQPDLLIGSTGSNPRAIEGDGLYGMIAAFMGGSLPANVDLITDQVVTTTDQWFVSPAELDDDAQFGFSVGFMGDQDGDGRDDVFVGAPKMENDMGQPAGRVYGFSLAASDLITITNLTQTVPVYSTDPSLTFTVQAIHSGGLPLKVTMRSDAFGITDVELIDNQNGTYSHTIPYPAIMPGFHDVQYFAVSPWDNTGGDGSFTLHDATVLAADDNVMYNAPADPVGATGLDYDGTPYSAVRWNFDDDEFNDLFIAISDDDSKLYQGDGISDVGIPHFEEWPNGEFTGGSPQPGLLGVTVGDLDNTDARTDLFAAHPTESRLYRWDDNTNKVVNVAGDVGLSIFNDAVAGTWGDLDSDGHLDLFLCRAENYTEDPPNYNFPKTTPASLVLTNTDDGTGGRVLTSTPTSGLPQNLFSTNATWGDYDLDGDPDLFVGAIWSVGAGASKLYRNDGGVLSDQTSTLLGPDPILAVVASSWHDMNNDALLDLVVTRHEQQTLIYFGSGSGFGDGAGGQGPLSVGPVHGFSGMAVYDYNNDGRMDYLGLSNDDSRASTLFLNVDNGGAPTFVELDTGIGLTSPGYVHGVVAADFGGPGHQQDGLVDLFLGRPTSSLSFYLKGDPYDVTTASHHFVGVRLIGAPGVINKQAVGATVLLEGPYHSQIQQIDGGSGRGGQSVGELVFGLGASSRPVTATIVWPNGQVYQDVALQVDQFNDITYDTATVIESTVESRYELDLDGQAVWIFNWETLSVTQPTVNAVHFDLVGTPYPCTPEVEILSSSTWYATVTCTQVAAGRYATEIRWPGRDCNPKCKIPFEVESGSATQTDRSEVNELSIGICAAF
ncbi:hypothetical protein DRQ50_09080, partial [bacterium]